MGSLNLRTDPTLRGEKGKKGIAITFWKSGYGS